MLYRWSLIKFTLGYKVLIDEFQEDRCLLFPKRLRKQGNGAHYACFTYLSSELPLGSEAFGCGSPFTPRPSGKLFNKMDLVCNVSIVIDCISSFYNLTDRYYLSCIKHEVDLQSLHTVGTKVDFLLNASCNPCAFILFIFLN